MRVLITVASLERRFGGPAFKARSLGGALVASGVEVATVGCGDGEAWASGVATLGSWHGTPVPRDLGPVRRAVDDADVVHVIGYRDPIGTAAARRASRVGVPYVIEPAGMHRRRMASLSVKFAFDAVIGRWVIGRAARVIATSDLERRELTEDGVDPASIDVRFNGVDVSDLLPLPGRGPLRARLGIPAEAPLIVAMGRIAAKKGLVFLADVVLAWPEAHLYVCGPDDGDGTLETLRRREGARVHIDARFVEDRAAVFADADVLCLPSASENFGTVAAEAAGVGVPVVMSDRTGASEALPDARVVAYGDRDALSSALREAASPAARAEAQRAAPEVRTRLDWRSLAERQVRIYERALSG